MPYQRVSTSVKQTIIDAFRKDDDYVEAAKLLGVKRTTAYDNVVQQQRGGFRLQRVKVDDEMREMAVRIVEEHPAFTLKQIIQELRVRLPDKPAFNLLSCKPSGCAIDKDEKTGRFPTGPQPTRR